MTSQFFVVSLIFLLANGTSAADDILLSKLANVQKYNNATTDLLLTMVNAINDLTKKVDRLTGSQEKSEPKDCSDIRASGRNVSGVYRITIGNITNRIVADVYCDFKSPDRSWLVFQRRQDGSENFERTWKEYANGFGNLTGEFWLGNNALNLLTSTGNYKLRIELEDFEGQTRYAEYSTFSIGSPSDKYRLTLSGYSGDAGDGLSGASGFPFSTIDFDNDNWVGSCAKQFHGAWWYNKCLQSNLNGLYLRGNHTSNGDGIEWSTFRYHYSLKEAEMKIAVMN